MKRLIFIASLAMLAVGCQKTEIQNEVLTPIGFSTEVGKQTRAIADGQTAGGYLLDQPFAVYAYGWQDGDANDNPVMNNVEIFVQKRTINSVEEDVWAATGDVKYYWPNDPSTTLNFYAYSPALVNTPTAQKDHQKLNGTIKHLETAPDDGSATAGFSLTGYKHSNMYVDFMVATPVLKATFGHPDGSDTQLTYAGTAGTVPLTFNHEMTQILFNVTTDKVYPGVKFTITEISLNNIKNKGDYSHATLTNSYVDTDAAFTHGGWTNLDVEGSDPYVIFPADETNGAVITNTKLTETGKTTIEAPLVLDYTNIPAGQANSANKVEVTTTGVTMIPQAITADVQSFTIKYSIEGTGVAEEDVEKTVQLYPTATNATVVHWNVNKKITYKVMIGLNEILFEPSVTAWNPETGNEYTFQQ